MCDTPDFDDTTGAEVDIANSVGVINAIKGCNSMIDLLLLSYKSLDDRLYKLKPLIHTISTMIPTISDHISKFSYLFTKFPDNEKNNHQSNEETLLRARKRR